MQHLFTELFENASWLTAVVFCLLHEVCSTASDFYVFVKASIIPK